MKLYQLNIWSPFDGPINYGYYRCKDNAALKAAARIKEGEEFIKEQYPAEDIRPYEFWIEEIKTED